MTLRFAYNTNGAANHRLDDAIRLIADSGYHGIALTLDHHHLDPFADGWAREAERIAAMSVARFRKATRRARPCGSAVASVGSCLSRGSSR